MEIFNWLIKWFESNCNGDWEHGNGINIETLDNPGWKVCIDLSETDCVYQNFETEIDNGDDDWYFCEFKNNIFKGCGDLNKLSTILGIFKDCVDRNQ